MSLINANIKVCSLKFISAKEEEVRKLGGELGAPDALSVEETRRFIAYIRKYVSFEVSLASFAFVGRVFILRFRLKLAVVS